MPNDTRTLHVKYEKGTLILDLHSILECVDPDQKREMLESISCDDEVIRFVTQQIIEKWTENGYSGGSCIHASSHPFGLDHAWREVAKASGEISRREIERLEAALTREQQENHRLRCENSNLRRGDYRAQ